MRFQFVFSPDKISLENFFATTALTPATDSNWHGITIFHAETNVPVGCRFAHRPALGLEHCFWTGRIWSRAPCSSRHIHSGRLGRKKMVLVSREPFDLDTGMPVKKQTLSDTTNGLWYVCEISSVRANEPVRSWKLPSRKMSFSASEPFPLGCRCNNFDPQPQIGRRFRKFYRIAARTSPCVKAKKIAALIWQQGGIK